MNCPECGHPKSTVIETRAAGSVTRRTRVCRACGKSFATLERLCVYVGRERGWIEDSLSDQDADESVRNAEPDVEPEQDEEPQPKSKAPKRPPQFVADVDLPELRVIIEEAKYDLVEWWNESRFSKHGKKATWTEKAWRSNVERLQKLPHWKQVMLAKAGVENGWQALKWEYLGVNVEAPAELGPQPKNTAAQEAIARWKLLQG